MECTVITEVQDRRELVVQVVARKFNMTPDDLKQRSRYQKVVTARHMAMYLLCMTQRYSLGEIGAALGGRTPAAVSHGDQRIALLVECNNTRIVRLIEEIKAEL